MAAAAPVRSRYRGSNHNVHNVGVVGQVFTLADFADAGGGEDEEEVQGVDAGHDQDANEQNDNENDDEPWDDGIILRVSKSFCRRSYVWTPSDR
jgi:hypothetical protein